VEREVVARSEEKVMDGKERCNDRIESELEAED
jgi:hypothetical protein